MKTFYLILCFTGSLLFFSCSKSESALETSYNSSELFSGSDERFISSSVPGGGGVGGSNNSGLITAGEWNDLENWSFWTDNLLNGEEFSSYPDIWSIYPKSRISVIVKDNLNPIINAIVELRKNGETVWQNRTDNTGKAELWIDLFGSGEVSNLEEYSLYVDGSLYDSDLVLVEDGVNQVEMLLPISTNLNQVDIAFIVDATGSMGDEIEFLKSDLNDVIQRVENENVFLNISTGTVFYRDEGDEYLVKHSDFTKNIETTIDFISEQSAGGGGDFPEAVHTGLEEAINTLEWSGYARTRIAFLLLDAPPHKSLEITQSLQNSIAQAARKGIKLIPITASGIDKETEFLMRFFSVVTNSTYVFITNDSGIGNPHIEASVGEYEVEFLNDLMVRLITEYSE